MLEPCFALRVGAEAGPSRRREEISLPEGGQLFRVKINQKSHFAVAMRAVELLLDLRSVLCPPDSCWALLSSAGLGGAGASWGPSALFPLSQDAWKYGLEIGVRSRLLVKARCRISVAFVVCLGFFFLRGCSIYGPCC